MFFEKPPVITSVDFLEFSFVRHSRLTVAPRPYSVLSYRRRGAVEIITGGTRYVSTPGTVTFISAGSEYETAVLESGEMAFMHFTTEGAERFADTVFTPPIPERFSNVFDEALRARNTGKALFSLSYAYRLLGELERALVPTDRRPPKRMSEAKGYIDARITSNDLRISDAAAIAGISEVYFRSEFRRFFGTSPIEYVKSRRIELAKRLLSTGLSSVTEAAISSGFDSISYFSSEFKRLTGVTPSEFSEMTKNS